MYVIEGFPRDFMGTHLVQWPTVRTILPGWFGHLVERFSSPPTKTSCHPAETANETPVFTRVSKVIRSYFSFALWLHCAIGSNVSRHFFIPLEVKANQSWVTHTRQRLFAASFHWFGGLSVLCDKNICDGRKVFNCTNVQPSRLMLFIK